MSGKIYTRVKERQQRAARLEQMAFRPAGQAQAAADHGRMEAMRREAMTRAGSLTGGAPAAMQQSLPRISDEQRCLLWNLILAHQKSGSDNEAAKQTSRAVDDQVSSMMTAYGRQCAQEAVERERKLKEDDWWTLTSAVANMRSADRDERTIEARWQLAEKLALIADKVKP